MQLSAAFFVALGPVLTTCQTFAPVVVAPPVAVVPTAGATIAPILVAPTAAPETTWTDWAKDPKRHEEAKAKWEEAKANGQKAWTDWTKPYEKYFGNPTSKNKCVEVPMMPTTFTAKRKFASFLNVIVFYDAKGEEFGFVESWMIDWKNPFGYAGASFYLKAPPKSPTQGIWAIDPLRGEDGWKLLATPAPASGDLKEEEADMWKKQEEYDREHGTKSAIAPGNHGFMHGIFGDHQNRLSAYITGDQGGSGVGSPFNDLMVVRDCQANVKFYAGDGEIREIESGVDAKYEAKPANTENTLSIKDRGTPAVELVRLIQKEPCSPFPPFCAQMGMWNWFLHGEQWEGQIVQPGYNQSVASSLGLTIKMTDGAATDIRFLTLYSAYQFSNTRWSPLMMIVMNILLVGCCLGCCRCCFTEADSAKAAAAKLSQQAREETEMLMKTTEAQETQAQQQQKPDGWMACCSRRGRNVEPLA